MKRRALRFLARLIASLSRRAARYCRRVITLVLPLAIIVALWYRMTIWTSIERSVIIPAKWQVQWYSDVGKAAWVAWRLDRAYDKIPAQPLNPKDDGYYGYTTSFWYIRTNSVVLGQWALEVVPYFEYENVVSEAIYPYAMIFMPASGQTHFHVLGQASCEYGISFFNYRMVNPYSPWYDRSDLLATIVHELGHVEGICSPYFPDFMEASNQVVTLEILAAMANHGNKMAIKPLVGELRDAAMDFLESHQKGRLANFAYNAFQGRIIYNSTEERSRRAKSLRFWEQNPDEYRRIITAYGAVPYQLAIEGIYDEQHRTAGLILGHPWMTTPFTVDDLAYFWQHLDEMVEYATASE